MLPGGGQDLVLPGYHPHPHMQLIQGYFTKTVERMQNGASAYKGKAKETCLQPVGLREASGP